MRDSTDIVSVPQVLVPHAGVWLETWAVVACDQFTSDPAYWNRVEERVGDSPSSLRMVLPEVHLTESEECIEERIAAINETMSRYMDEGILTDQGPGLVLLKRQIPGQGIRTGLLICIDLEHYEYAPGNSAPIRASEGTVLDRIPPRIRIRENAPLELPHVQLLLDDPMHTVIEPLALRCDNNEFPLLYDTPLMMDGGHVRGYRLPADVLPCSALSALNSYREHGLLMAVGDGNHSLVTARACWERLKEAGANPDHPARFAMAEIINLHDPGLTFEPIHRVLFGCSFEAFTTQATACYPYIASDTGSEADGPCNVIAVSGNTSRTLRFPSDVKLAVDWIEPILSALLEDPAIRLDYIHGESSLRTLATGNSVGLILPPLSKDRFFDDLIRKGVYPRKTFSMGEAESKRYYIEARRIR